MQDFDATREDLGRREWILRIARRLKAEPTLLGGSARVRAVACRPGPSGRTRSWPLRTLEGSKVASSRVKVDQDDILHPDHGRKKR